MEVLEINSPILDEGGIQDRAIYILQGSRDFANPNSDVKIEE